MEKISLKNISFVLIFHLFICLLVSELGFFLGFTIFKLYYPLSILISILICRINVISGISIFLIISFGFLISGYFFDLSSDGQSYHQEAIIQLKQGWNPILFESKSRTMKLWIDHYPKGGEIVQSTIYSFFGKKELGKAINIFLFIASLLLVRKTLVYFNISSLKRWLYAFFMAANPVVISQILTHFIDGLGYSLFVCLLTGLFLFIKTKDRIYGLMILASITLGGSLKFTSIPIFGVLIFCLLILLFILKKGSLVKELALPLGFSALFLFVCNYNPYITNLKEGKHIFYPLRGEGSINFLEWYTPKGFIKDNNRIEKLAFTLFTKTGSFDKDNMFYKIPFSVSQKELNRLSDADIGIGGFGIFYGGFLIVLFLFFIINWRRLQNPNDEQKLLFYIIFPILFSVLIISDPWWVRYIPQFYLIPLALLLALEINTIKIKNLVILKSILIVNILLFLVSVFVLNVYGTQKTYYILDMLKQSGKIIQIDARNFPSNIDRLEEFGIPYKKVEISNENKQIIRFQTKGSVIIDDDFKKPKKEFVYGFLNQFFYKID